MLTAFISWWYGAGWRQQSVVVSRRLAHLSDTFSLSLLLRTLFSPFRQISVGSVEGSFSNQIQAVIDKMISRVIGGMIRSTMLVTGVVVMGVYAVFGSLKIALWPLWLLLPVIAGVLWAMGLLSWN